MRVLNALIVAAALSTTACSGAAQLGAHSPGRSPSVAEDSRSHVMAAAATVFRRHGIPVRSVDQSRGLVTSEPFRVQYSWGGEPVARRLECPRSTAAENRLNTGLWEITVNAEAMPSAYSRSGPVVTGTAHLRENVGADDAAQGMACGLHAEYVNRLESEIQDIADELIRGDRALQLTAEPQPAPRRLYR